MKNGAKDSGFTGQRSNLRRLAQGDTTTNFGASDLFIHQRGKKVAKTPPASSDENGIENMTVPASILPANEALRMAAVRRYEILDTPSDGSFDKVTAIAARRFGVPISIISIVDHDRIWFKSHHGVDVQQIDREPGLCASAILSDDAHLLEDASKDVRSLANPLVAGAFGLRFYAGVPLRTSDGFNLGTLCVIDRDPRPISQSQIDDLKDLASLVVDQLEFRLSARQALAKRDAALEQSKLLAREIDHRVMNSLQFVSTLLRMQAKSAATGPEAAAQLETAAGRVATVARIHRHFHIEEETEKVPALAYLSRLCEDLSGVLGAPIVVEGEDGQLPTTAIQPVGLLVNELVTNAVKHGGGTITVGYHCAGGPRLSVRDQGAGLPEDFDPLSGAHGLGMKVATILARQLGGTLVAGPNPSGVGACFSVDFPAACAHMHH
jgi:two-component sensor histidine kinase